MSTGALERIAWTSETEGRAVAGHAVESHAVETHVIDVYHYAARNGAITSTALDEAAKDLSMRVSDVFSAVAQLVELRLLRPEDATGDRLVPADPQSAAALLISPIEREMFRQRDQADRLRERIEAIARPRAVADPVGTIDGLEGAAEIRGLLKLAADTCRHELVVMRPGNDDEETLEGLFEACAAVLDRGIAVRVVCPHSSRAGFASRAKVRRLVDGGAEIRTLSCVPQATAVFDNALAVMITLPENEGPQTARRVRDGNVVKFLIDMFDQLWQGAAPFALEDPGYADGVAEDLQRSIATLMAQGLTDEVVARRLGMSIRTCRRHIAALLQNLDSVSRFQAGVQAAHRFSAGGPLQA